MKKIKTIVKIFLIFLCILHIGSYGVEIKAEQNTNISIIPRKQYITKDEQFVVDVVIENNPGILGATLNLQYDDDLELLSCKKGEAFFDLSMTKPGKFEPNCKFVFDGEEIEEDDIKDGTILELTYIIKNDSTKRCFNIDISYKKGGIVDNNLNPVDITTIGSYINVYNPGTLKNNCVYSKNNQNIIENNFVENGKLLYSTSVDNNYEENNLTNCSAGEHDVYYKLIDNNNNVIIGPVKLGTILIDKATYIKDLDYTVPSGINAIYHQKLNEINLSSGWKWQNPLDDVGGVGTRYHNAIYWPYEDSNYYAAVVSVPITVKNASPKITSYPEIIGNIYYDGTSKKLIKGGSVENGIIKYAAVISGSQITDSTVFSIAPPTAVNIGTYDVYYKVDADPGYSNIEATFIGKVNIYESGIHINKIELQTDLNELVIGHNEKESTNIGVVFYPSVFDDDKTIDWESSNEEVATVDANGKVIALSPGFTYISATTSNGITSNIKIVVSENRVYKVIINIDGKSETQYVTENETIIYPEVPNKKGYKVALFSLDGSEYVEGTVVKEELILDLKYIPINYDINYYSEIDIDTTEFPKKYTIEENVVIPDLLDIDGYAFDGWYLEETYKNKITKIKSGKIGNIELYAKWKPIKYTIKYQLNGATNPKVNLSSFTVDSSFEFASPSKKGYKFLCWKDQSGNIITSTHGVYKNLTLTAYFELDNYLLTIDTKGVELTNEQTNNMEVILDNNVYIRNYDVNTATIILPTMTKTGYKFNGWNDTLTSKKITSIAKGSYGNKYIEASFTPITYKISYKTNSGKFSVKNKNDDHYATSYSIETSSLNLPNEEDIYRKGYIFDGWYASYDSKRKTYSNKIETIDDLNDFNNSTYKATTLYAKWEPVEYSITFVADGREPKTINNFVYDLSYRLDENIFNIPGYTVDKWSYVNNGKTKTISGNATIKNLPFDEETKSIELSVATNKKNNTEIWNITKYTITYNLDGGTNHKSNLKNYTIETPRFTLYAPTKKGASFNGWFDEEGYQVPYVEPSNNSYGNRIFTAKWYLNSYNITFDADGGILPDVYKTGNYIYTVDDSFVLVEPTKDNYTFAGWYVVKNNKMSSKILSIKKGTTQNYTLKAKWTEGTNYTITYDANNMFATGITKNTKAVAGKNTTLAKCGYKIDGKVFVEWNTLANGSGTSYQNKQVVEKDKPLLSQSSTDPITLYAIWDNPTTFTIEFDANGGTGSMKNQTMSNNAYKALANNTFKYEGHKFVGWNTKEDGTGTFYKNKAVFSGYKGEDNGSVVLYAIWE